MPQYDYRIASGYNVALGSLTNVEAISVEGRAFSPPDGYSRYDPGVFKIRGDGTVAIAGYAKTDWLFGGLTRSQVEYLSDTYCSGGVSGKVTILTRIGRRTYQVFNAVMELPKPTETERIFEGFPRYTVRFRRMVWAGSDFNLDFNLDFGA